MFIERLWSSLKCERAYLQAFETASEPQTSLMRWVGYDNADRPHA